MFLTETKCFAVSCKKMISLDFQADIGEKKVPWDKRPGLGPRFYHLQDSRDLEPFHMDNYELGLLRI